MKKKLLLVILVSIALLLLTSCKMEFGTTVQPGGSGQVTSGVGFTAKEKQALQNLPSSSGGASKEFCSNMQEQNKSIPGAQFREEQRGDETWCVTSVPFANLDELRKFYVDMNSVTINQLEITNGKFVYDVTLDFTSDQSTANIPIDVSWSLTVPGQVGNNNADSVSGSTLTWNLKMGATRTLHAESTTSAFNWTLVAGVALCCLCLIGLVVIALVAFFLMRRKK